MKSLPASAEIATVRRPKMTIAIAIGLVLVIAAAVRLPLLAFYPPVSYPDTGTYLQAAMDLLQGDFSTGMGRRTPGYPLAILLVGQDAGRIVVLQVIAGLVTSGLVAWLTWRLSDSSRVSLLAGLAHGLSMQQLFQEGTLLTESIAALSVAVALAMLYSVCLRVRNGESPYLTLLAVGAASAYALFVRPQFICLLVIAPLTVAYVARTCANRSSASRSGRGIAHAAKLGSTVLIAGVVLMLGWCAVLQAKTGYFTLSTQSGFGMVNHPIAYIELAPPQYAQVRDVLIKVRDERNSQVGHSRNTIWYAWPEIQRVTGWTLPEASRQLQAMCRQMFIEHPWRYARSVASAWVDFWTVPFFWKPEQVHPSVRRAVEGIWWVQHKLLRGANLAFVLLVAGVALWPALRRRVRWDVHLSAIAATVLMSSLIQALADQGASSRYHLPTQSLVVVVLMVAAARWQQSRAGVRRE